MKKLIFLFLWIGGQMSYANMASPIQRGTLSSSAFSSRDVDILKERIYIKIAADFRTAYFKIDYLIKTAKGGKQIPLLFHAIDYKGDFNVWLDNKKVIIKEIPFEFKSIIKTPYTNFSDYFSQPEGEDKPEYYVVKYEENSDFSYLLSDLKYFEAELSEGEHKISVEYTANAWENRSDWVNEYSIRYSLSPARYWKSFGLLSIILDATTVKQNLTCNLGNGFIGITDSIAEYQFSKLPSDYIEIKYKPEINKTAQILIAINPIGMILIVGLILVGLHFLFVNRYRRANPKMKYSWVVIIGSIVVPFLILFFYIMAYEIIDVIIGANASRYHGYTFMIMLFYPFFMPVYWLIMWLVDKLLKIRIKNKAEH